MSEYCWCTFYPNGRYKYKCISCTHKYGPEEQNNMNECGCGSGRTRGTCSCSPKNETLKEKRKRLKKELKAVDEQIKNNAELAAQLKAESQERERLRKVALDALEKAAKGGDADAAKTLYNFS